MVQAFIIVLREGFEAFLIVAITLTYLIKTNRRRLLGAVYWGILFSILASAGLGYLMREGVGQSFWEGVFGLVAIVLVGSLALHMLRHGARMKQEMENKLSLASTQSSTQSAFLGIFLFTTLMIAREGFEMVVLLIQVHDRGFAAGVALGVLAAVLLASAWVRFSHLINLKRFFQVTSAFLLLFLIQVGIYSVHEFSEAGIFPNSEAIHVATEPFSPVGIYGKWFSLAIVIVCASWLLIAWVCDRLGVSKKESA